MLSNEAIGWAAALIKPISVELGCKRRFKLMGSAERHHLVIAIASVAERKTTAYKTARSGVAVESFNWINTDPELAREVAVLNRHGVPNALIPPLPAKLIGKARCE